MQPLLRRGIYSICHIAISLDRTEITQLSTTTMNKALSINSNAINIQLIENDNSVTVRGHGPDGYVNRTILADDPEAGAKLAELLETLEAPQRAGLQDYLATAPDRFEAGITELKGWIEERFGEREETVTE